MYKGKHPRPKQPRLPKYFDNLCSWPQFSKSVDTDPSGNVTYYSYSSPVTFSNCRDVKQGVTNPRWKELRAKGLDASTPYSRIIWSSEQLPHFRNRAVWTSLPAVKSLTNSSYPYGVIDINPLVEDLNLLDEAIGRMKRKISSEVKNVSVITPAVELFVDFEHTVKSMAKLSTAFVVSYAGLIQAAKRQSLKRGAKFLSEAWLTYSFGMSPLMSEAKSIAEAIAAQIYRSGRFVRLQTGASKDWTSSRRDINQSGGGSWGYYDVDTQLYHTLSYKVITGINTEMLPSNWSFSDQLGLGMEYLPGVLWELTPFSWIVDYFTTIGAFLDDQFVMPPGMTSYIVVDRKYHCETSSSASNARANPSYMVSSPSGGGGITCDAFTRSILSALPHAAVRFKSFQASTPDKNKTETSNYAVSKLLNLVSVIVSGGNFARPR